MEADGSVREKTVKLLVEALFHALALTGALAAGAAVMAAAGISPWAAYPALWDGAAGSLDSFKETLVKATPLLLTGLAYSFAYRCGLFNIGAEGQLYAGALAGTAAALLLPPLPGWLHLPLALLCGMAGGALWGGIAGALKAGRGASEIISTIMLNYVGLYLVSYMVTGPLRDAGGSLPQSAAIPLAAELPKLLGSRLHAGALIALAAAIVAYLVLHRSTWGYEIRSAGSNRRAAEVAGMPVKRNTVLVLMASGAFAGLAGWMEIGGVQNRLLQNFSPGFGYDGIAVALLGGAHPLGNILSALLFGGLRSGANAMQRATGASTSLVYVIQAVLIILMLCNRYWLNGVKRMIVARLLGGREAGRAGPAAAIETTKLGGEGA
ncbi:ABC transporter permease [Paenibacillus albicereus]|uniref:ABC transporter permease n=1 Tax=Paenibacillus albicereus TaxID=2726185 RepID=A0A6H2GVR7_9BACL|nr:ABC transporter permease [Paenibacillus albicereus]QJC51238.1 ABC transporter permease [Paenibacillus albicereus]